MTYKDKIVYIAFTVAFLTGALAGRYLSAPIWYLVFLNSLGVVAGHYFFQFVNKNHAEN